MVWIFNYSELSVQEASKLLNNAPLCVLPATLQNHRVVFKGQSRKWGGAIASLERKKESLVYGSAFLVYPEEVKVFDRAYANSIRVMLPVVLTTEDVVKAYTYIQPTDAIIGTPSEEYSKAMIKHLRYFWDSSDGTTRLTLNDFLYLPAPTPKIEVPTKVETKEKEQREPQTVSNITTSVEIKKRGRPRKKES